MFRSSDGKNLPVSRIERCIRHKTLRVRPRSADITSPWPYVDEFLSASGQSPPSPRGWQHV